MSRTSSFLLFVLLLLGTASCSEREAPRDRSAHTATPETVDGDPPSHAQKAAAGQHGATDDESLPLLPIMLQMAADMSGQISAEELERIEAELGPETATFVAADEAVHQASVRLHEAAEAREMDVFLEQLATVQRGCVDCHSRFRGPLSTRRSANR